MQAGRPPIIDPRKGSSAPPPRRPAPVVFAQPLAALPRLAGARVLVVEDDTTPESSSAPSSRWRAPRSCVSESVAQAMDGVLPSFDPDVVLTDFSMPDRGRLRSHPRVPARAFDACDAVPILILSGHSEDDWRARALAAGAADVLIKPFDPVLLIARIAAAVAAGRTARD